MERSLCYILWSHIVVSLLPGWGFSSNLWAFAMGTNCEPPWTNLVMRHSEQQHKEARAPTLRNPCYLQRFIDDGLVFHPKRNAEFLKRHLAFIHPPRLWFEFTTFAEPKGIAFLDLLFISLNPLVHTVYFKPPHSCNYVLFNSNTPAR